MNKIHREFGYELVNHSLFCISSCKLVLLVYVISCTIPSHHSKTQSDEYGPMLRNPAQKEHIFPRVTAYRRGNGLQRFFDSRQTKLPFVDKMKDIYRRDVPEPIQSAKNQLSAIVYLMNAAVLGEAIVQNLTTFGEIATSLMIVQNMPMDEDWISSIDSSSIDMSQLGELQKVIENGNDVSIPLDLLDKLMVVVRGIDTIDSISQAAQTINQVMEKYNEIVELDLEIVKGLQLLDFLPQVAPIVSNLSSDPSPLDSILVGIETLKSSTKFDPEQIQDGFKDCHSFDSATGCVFKLSSNFKSFSDKLVVNDLETSANVIRLFYYSKEIGAALSVLESEKKKMSKSMQQLSNYSSLISKLPSDFDLQKTKLPKIMDALSSLKDRTKELNQLNGTIKVFNPISNVVEQIKNVRRTSKSKRQTKNQNQLDIESLEGLPEGINSLNDLFKSTRSSYLLPKNYQSSRIVERVEVLRGLTSQRGSFLKVSEGIGSVKYISDVVQNIQTILNTNLDFGSMKNKVDALLSEWTVLTSIGDMSEVIGILENTEKRIDPSDTSKWVTIRNQLLNVPVNFDWKVLNELFLPLSKVVDFASKVNIALSEPVLEDERKKLLALADTYPLVEKDVRELANVIKVYGQSLETPKIEKVQAMKDAMKTLSIDVPAKSGSKSIEKVENALKSVENLKTKIDAVVKNKTEQSRFSSKMSELNKLKPNDPITKPSTQEIDAFKPMVEEYQKLKPLTTPAELRREKPSSFMKELMKGKPYGSNVLKQASSGLRVYRKMVKDIPSTDSLKKAQIVPSVAGLLEGVDTLQVMSAEDNPNAFNVFSDWNKIENGLKELEGYVESTVAKKANANLDPIISKESGLVYRFLGQLDASTSKSIAALRTAISVMVKSLRQPDSMECSKGKNKNPEDPKCQTLNNGLESKLSSSESEERSSNMVYYIIIGAVVSFVLVGVIIFFLYKRCKKGDKPVKSASSGLVKNEKENVKSSNEVPLPTPKAYAKDSECSKPEKQPDPLPLPPVESNTKSDEKEKDPKPNPDVQEEPTQDGEPPIVIVNGRVVINNYATFRETGHNRFKCLVMVGNEMETLLDKPVALGQVEQLYGQNEEYKKQVRRMKSVPLRKAGFIWPGNNVQLRSGTYIPASKITIVKTFDFIATQAPFYETIPAFCEMLHQEEVSIIMQLCSFDEMNEIHGQKLCMAYLKYAGPDYTITSVADPSFVLTQNYNGGIVLNNLTITDVKNGKTRNVIHLCHLKCPDGSVPPENDSFLDLLAEIKGMLKKHPGKVVVHCLAGIGRTMLFITIAYVIEKVEGGSNEFQVATVVNAMRRERNGAIQTLGQYLYLLVAVSNYSAKKGVPECVDFYRDFAQLYSKIKDVELANKITGEKPIETKEEKEIKKAEFKAYCEKIGKEHEYYA